MDYNKSKAENRAINNTKGPQNMGDNGPRKIFGSMGRGGNKDGTKSGKLYGKTDSAGSSSGIGGNMSGNGYPNPPRQSMASGKPGKPTTMKLGGGTVHAEMKYRSGESKALRGGSDGE